VSTPHLAPPSGRASLPHCERCGNLIGPAATLLRIGLRMCPSCGVDACDRCWGRAEGECPGCGASMASTSEASVASETAVATEAAIVPETAVAADSAIVSEGGLERDRRGRGRRSPIVYVVLVVVAVAVSVLALNSKSPFRAEGEVAGATGTPAALSGTGSAAAPSALPSPAAGAAEAPIGSPASPSLAATAVAADPSGTPVAPGGVASSSPVPTPSPKPRRTAAPTPRPTPAPTPRPTPAPTPCALVAPQLIGEHKASAATIWSGAGFSGTVTTLPGHGNYLIASQDLVAGQTYPCSSSVTVGP
jgi:hypothetical protein